MKKSVPRKILQNFFWIHGEASKIFWSRVKFFKKSLKLVIRYREFFRENKNILSKTEHNNYHQ